MHHAPLEMDANETLLAKMETSAAEGRKIRQRDTMRSWLRSFSSELTGCTYAAGLLEVVMLVREDGSELVIHAMRMRPKYRRLLPGD